MGKDLRLSDEMELEPNRHKAIKAQKQLPKSLKSKGIQKEKTSKKSLENRMEEETLKKNRIRKKKEAHNENSSDIATKKADKASIQQAILFKNFNKDIKSEASELFKILDEKDKNKHTKSGKKRDTKRKNLIRKKVKT
jgi:hypothetical protein